MVPKDLIPVSIFKRPFKEVAQKLDLLRIILTSPLKLIIYVWGAARNLSDH